MKMYKNRSRKGFTLIELLVTVLILAILMAIALPLYLSAVADSERKTCRANMQTIANAVQAARVKAVAANYGAIIAAGVAGLNVDLGSTPICPASGTYSLENGASGDNTTYRVACSVTAHGKFQPGVDAN
jgi:type IV pilus assembly protein PilA